MTHHNGGTSGDYCSDCGELWESHLYTAANCPLACPVDDDEPEPTYDGMTAGLGRLIDVLNDPYGELEVFEGIETLLRDDRARAQQMWYPIKPDGTFNR